MAGDLDQITGVIVDSAFHVHVGLCPGLLEAVYEEVLSRDLGRKGLKVRRQEYLSFEYDGIRFENILRLDLLVEEVIVVELKSVERLERVHHKQLLTYLRLLHLPIGLLINFGAGTFKEGIHRIVNNYHTSAAPRLRVNQPSQPYEKASRRTDSRG